MDGSATPAGCSFGEPNNTRETATPVALNRIYAGNCVDGPGDPMDFYEFTAPAADVAGGYVQVQVRNVGGQSAEYEAWAASDNEKVQDHYSTTDGANLDGWFTVAPGGKYRVAVHMFAGTSPEFTYDVQFKYTALNDAFEPNNSRATAKPLTLGTAIMASAAVPALGGLAPTDAEKDDWYSVTLAAGTTTVLVSNVPSDTTCDVTAFDPSGAMVDEKYSTTDGANCKLDLVDLTMAGTYTFNMQRFAGAPPREGDGATVPAFVSGQYTLLVTQP